MKLFVIGAGFTRSIFADAPLNSTLLPDLAALDDNEASRTLLGRYGTPEIEIALTKLDADVVANPAHAELQNLRERLEFEIVRRLDRLSITTEVYANTPWLSRFGEQVVSEGDVFVSLNYDCILEAVLDCARKWSPNGGYGVLHNPLVDDRPLSRTKVLKIHGSTSFVSAPAFDAPEIRMINFRINENLFPVSGAAAHLGYGAGLRRPFVLAPSYIKIPTVEIHMLMLEALRAASDLNMLVIVGCGMRREDSFLMLLMATFLHRKVGARIVLVDPRAHEIANNLSNYWTVGLPITCIEANLQDGPDQVVDLVD
jgi:hypothetical protein